MKDFGNIVIDEELIEGQLVDVRYGDRVFDGKIVGIGTISVNPGILVECLDGFIPNVLYPYKVVSIPLSEIRFKK